MLRRYQTRPIFRTRHRISPLFIPLLITAIVAVLLFRYISAQLSPIIRTVAESKVSNLIAQMTAAAVDDALLQGKMSYDDFVTTGSDAGGQVLSISFRTAEGAAFKRQVTQRLAGELESISPDELAIPFGTLSGVLLFSAIGPSVRVRVQSIGDVSAEYQNEFTSAGVNQTRHAVYLNLTVTVYLLIPGEIVAVTSSERVCVAETIIVGQVPDTYLNLQNGVR